MSGDVGWLAARVRTAGEAAAARRSDRVPALELAGAPPPAAMLDVIAAHLHAGETHYTNRPGIIELRESIAGRINELGGPRLDAAKEIVVTASAGEALFVALLALGLARTDPRGAKGAVSAPQGGGRHAALFELLDIDTVDRDRRRSTGARPSVLYLEHPEGPERTESRERFVAVGRPASGEEAASPPDHILLLDVGDLLARDGIWPTHDAPTIAVGSLDALPGMDSLRIGFAAGPAELVKQAMTWKQAFSICTAAPSQRAAIWALARQAGGNR